MDFLDESPRSPVFSRTPPGPRGATRGPTARSERSRGRPGHSRGRPGLPSSFSRPIRGYPWEKAPLWEKTPLEQWGLD